MAAAASRDRSSVERALDLRRGAPFAGKYVVERILGRGGMGTVFEAKHVRLGHRVAIKVLGSELRDYPELVMRFEREARAAGALSSRHVVRVFDIDMTEDATPFIVMELLVGEDLADVVERDGAQPVGRAVRWVLEACDAIAEAHRLGIIHRDIKPSNLFLSDEGVKVLDFGIAKRIASKEAAITQAVAPLGTPQYMSPEQVRCAKDVDTRTDIWSVGVTLFELLTGRTPFAQESSSACIASIAADPVPDPRSFRPDLPSELVDVLMRALEKDRTRRYGSITELAVALAPFAERDVDEHPASAVCRIAARKSEDAGDSGVRASVRAATTLTRAASRGPVARRRWASSLAVGTASLLGVFALLVTPKCVGSLDAPAATATPSTAPIASALAEPPAAPSTPIAPSSDAIEAAPAPPVTVAPAPVAAASATKRARSTATNGRPRQEATIVRHFPIDSPAHGGLSGPGF